MLNLLLRRADRIGIAYISLRPATGMRRPGPSIKRLFILNFYGDFQVKFYKGFPIQILKIHFIGIFQSKNFPLFSGPRAWVGLLAGGPSGCSACARADARYRETPRTTARRLLPKSGFLGIIRIFYVASTAAVITRRCMYATADRPQAAAAVHTAAQQVRAHYISHDG